jgi:hypothetical protein
MEGSRARGPMVAEDILDDVAAALRAVGAFEVLTSGIWPICHPAK